MIEVTAYCPTCGGLLKGHVKVTGVQMNDESSVLISLKSSIWVKHRCQRMPQDARSAKGFSHEDTGGLF